MANGKRNYDEWSKEELVREILALKKQKTYGLVWEREKTKEEFDLFINWEGEKTKEEFSLESKDKFPVLAEVKDKEISTDKEKPVNLLIEGDNYHSLAVLNFTHKGAIDVIYIDPPYNTGKKDFKYNDKFVDIEDGYRHSKWLSFMSKRLALAKNLLKDTGVVFISIDDNEVAQLKLLCDDLFGEENFLGNIIWQTTTDNNPSQVAIEHEYILAYSKNKKIQPKWSAISIAGNKIQTKYLELKGIHGSHVNLIQKELRSWIRVNKKDLNKVAHYNSVDEKGVYQPGDASNPHPGGYNYQVIHPTTKKPCKLPPNGYRWPLETFKELLSEGNIEFGKDHNIIIKPKRRLNNVKDLLRSIYYEDNRRSTNELAEILGNKLFDNPKSPRLIKFLISFVTNSKNNNIILDFFAGSGTTGQSVLELNKDDNGNRKFILCTNNEDNNGDGHKICTDICYPRIQKIIKGYTTSNNGKIEGLSGNLKYFKTDFVEAAPTDKNKRKLVDKCTEMLCIKENAFDKVKDGKKWKIFKNNNYHLGIIFDEEYIEDFVKESEKLNGKINVYVFSHDDSVPTKEFKAITNRVTLCAIPETILKVYRKVFKND